MKQQHTFRIVVTGPESSGKTTLARLLAEALDSPWAPEFARYYVASLGRAYLREDLARIAAGQAAWAAWYGNRAKGIVVEDTDWTVIYIWEKYKYAPDLSLPAFPPADAYLLCAPDIPWEPDPLRENPNERAELYTIYYDLLLKLNVPFTEIKGNFTQRLKTALEFVNKIS